MAEARRRAEKKKFALSKNNQSRKSHSSQRIFSWLPITEEQEQLFIELSIKGAWFGIGLLVLLWVVVRFIGPAAGWWIPADLH